MQHESEFELILDLQTIVTSSSQRNGYATFDYQLEHDINNRGILILLLRKALRRLQYKITRIDSGDHIVIIYTNVPWVVHRQWIDIWNNYCRVMYNDLY